MPAIFVFGCNLRIFKVYIGTLTNQQSKESLINRRGSIYFQITNRMSASIQYKLFEPRSLSVASLHLANQYHSLSWHRSSYHLWVSLRELSSRSLSPRYKGCRFLPVSVAGRKSLYFSLDWLQDRRKPVSNRERISLIRQAYLNHGSANYHTQDIVPLKIKITSIQIIIFHR